MLSSRACGMLLDSHRDDATISRVPDGLMTGPGFDNELPSEFYVTQRLDNSIVTHKSA